MRMQMHSSCSISSDVKCWQSFDHFIQHSDSHTSFGSIISMMIECLSMQFVTSHHRLHTNSTDLFIVFFVPVEMSRPNQLSNALLFGYVRKSIEATLRMPNNWFYYIGELCSLFRCNWEFSASAYRIHSQPHWDEIGDKTTGGISYGVRVCVQCAMGRAKKREENLFCRREISHSRSVMTSSSLMNAYGLANGAHHLNWYNWFFDEANDDERRLPHGDTSSSTHDIVKKKTFFFRCCCWNYADNGRVHKRRLDIECFADIFCTSLCCAPLSRRVVFCHQAVNDVNIDERMLLLDALVVRN